MLTMNFIPSSHVSEGSLFLDSLTDLTAINKGIVSHKMNTKTINWQYVYLARASHNPIHATPRRLSGPLFREGTATYYYLWNNNPGILLSSVYMNLFWCDIVLILCTCHLLILLSIIVLMCLLKEWLLYNENNVARMSLKLWGFFLFGFQFMLFI